MTIENLKEMISVNPLQCEMKVYVTVDYYELNRFISFLSGKEYDFVADQECGNDSEHEFNLEGIEPFDDDIKKIESFLYGDGNLPKYSTGDLLQYLAQNEIIPFGTYLVKVSW
jgi:hypothetical protein